MLLLNLKTLYVADDYVYRFVYHTEDPTKMPQFQHITTSLIPYSMWNHYFNWNGRFVAHTIVQYFMQFNTKIPFDICSSLIYVLLIWLLNKMAMKLSSKKYNAFILPLIFFFTWFFIPYFGQSVLWLSGSGNYLWMSIIYLGFILYNLKNRNLTVTNVLLGAVLGFLAGASNENSGPAAVLIVLLFMLKHLTKERRINFVSLTSVIFSGVGFLLMIMSPGSQKRGAIHRTWPMLQKNFQKITDLTFPDLKWVYLALIVLLIVAIVMKKINQDAVWSVVFFLIGHFASIYAMAFSPEFPARTFFGGVMFLTVALFIIVYSLFSEMTLPMFGLSAVVAVLFLFSFIPVYKDINVSYHQMNDQYQAIELAKKQHKTNADVKIIVPSKSKYNATNSTIAMDESPDMVMNLWEAHFFNIKQISGYH